MILYNNYNNQQLLNELALDMRWLIANEARSAELAITNLVSNKGEWNNCFIKLSTFAFAKFYLSLRKDKKEILC